MKRILWSSVLLILWAANVWADEQPAQLDAIVVKASRSDDTVGQMNKGVTIITSDQIAASPAKSVLELISGVQGVNARANSNVKDTQVDMGQFGETGLSNVVILFDGRRLNSPDLSGPDLSLIDLNAIDRIEIVQGSGSVLYGDNASGGVINIVTKKGQENARPSVTLSSEVDSYKGNKDGMQLSGGIPKLAYAFNYDRQQSNNYRTYNNYWANDYDTRLNYDPTDVFGVDFEQGYHLDRYRLPGGISLGDYFNSFIGVSGATEPGIASIGRTGAVPFNIGYGAASDSYFNITPRMKFDEGNSHFDLSLFTSARKDLVNFVSPNANGFNNPFSTNYEEESYQFQPKVIVSSTLTDRLDNKLTAGYDNIYYREKRRSNSTNSDGTVNPEDIVHASETSQNVYLLDEMTLDERWLVNAGARGAWTDYVFNQTKQTPAKFDRSKTTEAYDGGFGYKYNPDSKVFVDYSHSYRLPNIDEFFQSPFESFGVDTAASVNSNLGPQKGNQYQLGVKDRSIKGLHLGFTATQAQYKNEIYFDSASFLNTNYNGRTRHYSEEASIAYDMFAGKLQPFADITFQQAQFISGKYSGNQLTEVPDHLANAGITYNPLPGLSTSVTTHFVGKQFLISDQNNTHPKIKRYDTVDWNIKYDFNNIEVWFALKNIFNSYYFNYGLAGSLADVYWPAPGRNVAAGMKVKF
jgi:iron complex outermembrane receptor protein